MPTTKKKPLKASATTAAKRAAVSRPATSKTIKKPAAATRVNGTKFVPFRQAVKNFFSGYVDFRGISTRAEYWWSVLAVYGAISLSCILGMVLMFTGSVPVVILGGALLFFAFILLIASIIPFIMLTIRRMHDIGKSGWHYYGIEIAGVAIYYAITFYAVSLMTKSVDLVANADGVMVEMIVRNSTTGSEILSWSATALSIAISVYLLVLLIMPSKLANNKYRK